MILVGAILLIGIAAVIGFTVRGIRRDAAIQRERLARWAAAREPYWYVDKAPAPPTSALTHGQILDVLDRVPPWPPMASHDAEVQ